MGAAYGLSLRGRFRADEVGLADVSAGTHDGWPLVQLSWGRYLGPRPPEAEDDEHVLIHLVGGFATARRHPLAIDIRTTEPLTAVFAVHPLLAGPARIAARWTGRSSFYGGSFVAAGGAWAVLGGTGSGKTTLLCELARQGCKVLSDDMTVLEGTRALAGPRLLAVRDLTWARGLEVLRDEPWPSNVHLARAGPSPADAPLMGWFVLDQGAQVGLRRATASELLRRVRAGLSVCPETPELLLQLVALPAWSLTLPEIPTSGLARLSFVEAAAQAVLREVARSPSAPFPIRLS